MWGQIAGQCEEHERVEEGDGVGNSSSGSEPSRRPRQGRAGGRVAGTVLLCLDPAQVLDFSQSLNDDEPKPTSRILRKRVSQRTNTQHATRNTQTHNTQTHTYTNTHTHIRGRNKLQRAAQNHGESWTLFQSVMPRRRRRPGARSQNRSSPRSKKSGEG